MKAHELKDKIPCAIETAVHTPPTVHKKPHVAGNVRVAISR